MVDFVTGIYSVTGKDGQILYCRKYRDTKATIENFHVTTRHNEFARHKMAKWK
jgi:hypothetical protein